MERPLLFAPAMNTYMWQHPLTAQHVATLKTFGYHEICCVSKKLACGDTGLLHTCLCSLECINLYDPFSKSELLNVFLELEKKSLCINKMLVSLPSFTSFKSAFFEIM